jgi:hypothetical protein
MILLRKKNRKKLSGRFSLKEPLVLSYQGKNVHVKLLRLCACLLEEKNFQKGRKFSKNKVLSN